MPASIRETLATEDISFVAASRRVVLALEAPMAVPVPIPDAEGWRALGKARAGEGNRPWSAGAGSLATGLAQGAWMLSRLHAVVPDTGATTQLDRFDSGRGRILLVEAFVSSTGKPVAVSGGQHAADAEAAARAVLARLTVDRSSGSDVSCAPRRAFNLLAAMALWAGLSIDGDELGFDVLVVRSRPVVG